MNNKTIKKIQFGGWNKQKYREIRGVIKRMTKDEIEESLLESAVELNKQHDDENNMAIKGAAIK